MAKYQNKTKQGFTIIEVVLVLAIGGLIMLMVFLALPALQRSQRDTQRRNQLGEWGSQLVQFQSNNRGKVPTDQAGYETFMKDYLRWSSDRDSDTNEFIDPDGEAYLPIYECEIATSTDASNGKCNSTDANTARTNNYDGVINTSTGAVTKGTTMSSDKINHTIHIFRNARCNGETLEMGTGARNVAITMKLENGWYCGTN